MNKKRMVASVGVAVLIVVLAIGTFWFQATSQEGKKSYAAIIEKNFEEMNATYSTETLLSSNPYDYTKNKHFKNIVDLGMDAVEILQEKGKSDEFSSLNSYVAAIAIQEITGVDLYAITGVDYETADEFYSLWDKTLNNLPETMSELVQDKTSTLDEKVKNLENYGVFGEALLNEIESSPKDKVNFHGEKITYRLMSDEENKVKKAIRNDKNVLDKANDYLDKYAK